MRFVPYVVLAAMLAPAPAQAASAAQGDAQFGTFVGARVQLRLGGRVPERARASLTIAPTRSTSSSGGEIRTQIGEGIAFNLAPGAQPSLTLAGVRADQILGMNQQGTTEADRKLGLSTGAWIGIGVVTAVILGAVVFSNYCDHKLSSICGDSE